MFKFDNILWFILSGRSLSMNYIAPQILSLTSSILACGWWSPEAVYPPTSTLTSTSTSPGKIEWSRATLSRACPINRGGTDLVSRGSPQSGPWFREWCNSINKFEGTEGNDIPANDIVKGKTIYCTTSLPCGKWFIQFWVWRSHQKPEIKAFNWMKAHTIKHVSFRLYRWYFLAFICCNFS